LKKRGIIGIGITFLVLSVIIGIASLPDEVLLESTIVENSQTMSDDQDIPPNEAINDFIIKSDVDKNLENTKAELEAFKKELMELKNELSNLKIDRGVLEEETTVVDAEDDSPGNQTEGRVITVNLKDGVGAFEQ